MIAGYLFSVVAANIASVHWPPLTVGGMLLPAGTLFVGIGLTLRDLVHDRCGSRGVTAGIIAGAGLSAVFASPRIAVACVVAFTVSEVLDTLVYTRLRHRTRTGAVAASNAAGLVVDSVLFVPLAFGSFAALPGQITGKAAATVLTLAALHTARCRRRRTART
ncbi:VUT family protein [Saccharothrix luteola]|uniref:VUT family protein n=1 Tax=Saccharothrix luteola TaxID=2893018 RepID=UPI001E42575B|nr:VUT family protein [Saccharothrix luteola]MCC8244990.1 VUT family protein [Saccharothrix luteola]